MQANFIFESVDYNDDDDDDDDDGDGDDNDQRSTLEDLSRAKKGPP